MSSICSSSFHFRVMVAFRPHWKHSNKNLHYWILSHSKRKLVFSSFSHGEDSPSPTKQNQTGYDPSEELLGLASDLHPRKVVSGASKPRSWFGPNGQYIRESPCPSCRGRGYTPCTECGIERSRLDCSLCNGKGIVTCHLCLGDCVIWEESIDERPWEKAQSISPFKMEEDDEVDNLDIKLDAKRKTKRVYQSPSPEVNLKISKSLKSLNARTGLFSKRMKIIHRDPVLHAQRVAAIKKAKGTAAARKQASEAMKNYFRDPENRRKRSLSMKAAKFYCRNCGREGHRSNYCPDIKDIDRRFTCRLCGEKGHNKRTCPKSKLIVPRQKINKNLHCRICGQRGHNRRTCPEKTEQHSTGAVTSKSLRGKYEEKEGYNERTNPKSKLTVPTRKVTKNLRCTICGEGGHNRRTCPEKSKVQSPGSSATYKENL